MSKRIFLTSDTHGEAERFREALKLANFDYENDRLIHLGDCVDRGPDSKGVIDELLKIKDLISIKGNHDDWFLELLNTKYVNPHYLKYGGKQTIESYNDHNLNMSVPTSHINFLKNQQLYYIDDQNRFFCHAGFNRHYTIEENEQDEPSIFYWDRDLLMVALSTEKMQHDSGGLSEGKIKFKTKSEFKRIFIGHTATINWKRDHKPVTLPIYSCNIVNVDTGACMGGKLSLLDITDDENHILYQT